MITFLAALLIAAQGIPTLPGTGGTVTGNLKLADGTPAMHVRVAASTQPDSLVDANSEAALVSLTQTDENGHFELENVPQGRYFIIAGRLTLPIYYPGTSDVLRAKSVLVSAGTTVSSINFVIGDAGSLSDDPFAQIYRSYVSNPRVSLPVEIKVDSDGKLPVLVEGKTPVLRLSNKTGISQSEMNITETSMTVALTQSGVNELRVTVENLPDGYVVKSAMFGSADLKTETLKLSPPPADVTSAYAKAVVAEYQANSSPIPAILLGLQSSNALVLSLGTPPSLPTPPPATTPAMTLSISLAVVPPVNPPVSGVRITGKSPVPGVRPIYISDRKGIVFSDGSFEFRGVPPGRHIVASLEEPKNGNSVQLNMPASLTMVMAAGTVVVGNQDIENVILDEIKFLPPDFTLSKNPEPADGHAPGAVPLTKIHARILEDSTNQPVGGGTITINGQARSMFRVGTDGQFEIPGLFPGTYKIEIGTFGYSTIRETVVIEEGARVINLDLTSTKL